MRLLNRRVFSAQCPDMQRVGDVSFSPLALQSQSSLYACIMRCRAGPLRHHGRLHNTLYKKTAAAVSLVRNETSLESKRLGSAPASSLLCEIKILVKRVCTAGLPGPPRTCRKSFIEVSGCGKLRCQLLAWTRLAKVSEKDA